MFFTFLSQFLKPRSLLLFKPYRKIQKNSTMPVKLVWIDMEMTGLDIEKDVIMEIACILTDKDLNVIHKGFDTILKVDDDKLAGMNEWCTNQHQKTGLTDACRKSTIDLSNAERELCEYLQKYTQQDVLYMAGNTIYMDRMFLNKYMPLVNEKLHYRMLDVSSLKILQQCWQPNVKLPKKRLLHRALDDIQDSIDELKFYRTNFFK